MTLLRRTTQLVVQRRHDARVYKGTAAANVTFCGEERQSVKRRRDCYKNRGKPQGLAATCKEGPKKMPRIFLLLDMNRYSLIYL